MYLLLLSLVAVTGPDGQYPEFLDMIQLREEMNSQYQNISVRRFNNNSTFNLVVFEDFTCRACMEEYPGICLLSR
jgi:hypothetical protein